MIEYVVYALLGVVFGSVTGLIPGLHINAVALIVLSFFFTYQFDGLNLAVFIISMGVTHSFVDFVPSIFLGVPDSNTVLSVQPAHRMLLRGRGFEAVVLSVVGGLFGVIMMIGLFAVLMYVLPVVYSSIRSIIPFLLVFVVVYMILIDKNRAGAAVVTLFSLGYGVVLMNAHIISQKYVLFVMLTSLFAVSTLILSYSSVSELPLQKGFSGLRLKELLSGASVGFLGGVVAGVLPGIGSSQSAILVQKFGRIKGMRKFIVALGTINTIAIFMSVVSLYVIGRARSGSAIVIGDMLEVISLSDVYLFLAVTLFSTGLAAILTIELGRMSARHIHKVNYRKMVLFVLLFLLGMIFFYTGFGGILVCVTGTAIGVLPSIFGTKKSLLLSCLIVPTILYLTGMDYAFLRMIGL